MNQQQLQELGYNVTTGPWTVIAERQVTMHPALLKRQVVWRKGVHVPDGSSHGEKLKLGWEACLIHWAAQRLEGK